MNTIEFKNNQLATIANYLMSFELQGKASRYRSKLSKLLEGKYQEYVEERNELLRKYAKLENGEIASEDGKVIFEDSQKERQATVEVTELDNETSKIDVTEIDDKLKALLEALDNLEETLAGEKAVAYDLICEQLESIE